MNNKFSHQKNSNSEVPQEVAPVLPPRGARTETPGALGTVARLRRAASGGQRGDDHPTAGAGKRHGGNLVVAGVGTSAGSLMGIQQRH